MMQLPAPNPREAACKAVNGQLTNEGLSRYASMTFPIGTFLAEGLACDKGGGAMWG
jgi:hypothetical protein